MMMIVIVITVVIVVLLVVVVILTFTPPTHEGLWAAFKQSKTLALTLKLIGETGQGRGGFKKHLLPFQPPHKKVARSDL